MNPMAMKFLAPGWLWLLLVLPLIFAVVLWDERRRRKLFSAFAEPALWPRLAPEYDPRARTRKAGMLLLSLAFGILAMARPQWGAREEKVQLRGMDIVLALDLSNSMEAEDVVPSRLAKAKHAMRSLLEQLQGDRVALVGFAGSASILSPLTSDMGYLQETLELMSTRTMGVQGSQISLGLEAAQRALDRGAESSSTGEDTPNAPPSQAVILFSDGEEHDGAGADSAEKLKRSGAKLYVLGVGTEKGAPIPVRDEQGSLVGYKRDSKGQPVVTSFKPQALQRIAETGGGRYWNVSDTEAEVQVLLEDLGALNRGDYAERSFLVYEERFQYPLAIAVLLLLIELSLPARKIGAAMVLLISLAGAFPSRAEAYPFEAYEKNDEGLKAYQRGELEEAKRRFGEAQALDPNLDDLEFNRGTAQAKQGDVEGAEKAFRSSAESALKKNNPALAGKSLFNLGSTLSKKGDVKGALDSYLGSAEAARRSGDADLERDALKNLELLVKQEQQKKQQQKQDQKQGQQDQQQQQQQQQQSQDQKQGQGQGSDQEKNEQGQKDKDQDKKDQGRGEEKDKDRQNKPVEDPSVSRRRFKSKNLTGEDAERVMAELGNKERELRDRLNRQKGSPKRGSLPDW